MRKKFKKQDKILRIFCHFASAEKNLVDPVVSSIGIFSSFRSPTEFNCIGDRLKLGMNCVVAAVGLSFFLVYVTQIHTKRFGASQDHFLISHQIEMREKCRATHSLFDNVADDDDALSQQSTLDTS